jgi:hypothetical protein
MRFDWENAIFTACEFLKKLSQLISLQMLRKEILFETELKQLRIVSSDAQRK